MNTKYFIGFLLILKINAFCQTHDSLKLTPDPIVIENVDPYYINLSPKVVNGHLYNGVDTSYRTIGGEDLLVIEKYTQGFKTDLKTYYDNGKQECHFQWKDGVRDGISKRWYKSGKILFDFLMKDGKKVGVIIHYFENGNPKFISDPNVGLEIELYDNGKMKRMNRNIDSSQCNGLNGGYHETLWDKNGQLSFKGTFNCGKQKYIRYYNDSTVASIGSFVDLELFYVGNYVEYFENGKKKVEGQFSDCDTQNCAGLKIGTWKYWNEKGKLVLTVNYEDNRIISSKKYR